MKTLLYIKKYWYILCIVLSFLLVLLLFFKNKNSVALLNATIDSYKKQIEEIEKINKEIADKKQQQIILYEETIKKLEEKHKQDQEQLEQWKKDEVKKIINKYGNDEKKLSEALKKEFGL